MDRSGPIYSGKELSDFIFPVFLSFLKNSGDFLSGCYGSAPYRNALGPASSCLLSPSCQGGQGL